MPRPRVHSLDDVLDSVEELLVLGEREMTIRAVADLAGASSGSLYHAFGSRNELLARAWLRAARRFLTLQSEAVDSALDVREPESASYAVVAAASTLTELGKVAPSSARLLIEYEREALLGEELPKEVRAEFMSMDKELLSIMERLADAALGRRDRRAIDIIAICIVDLPTALLKPRRKRVIPGRQALKSAVLGVLDAADELLEGTPTRV